MSLGKHKAGPAGPAGVPSPSSYDEWIPRDFPDDLLFDSNFDQPLNLTADEEKLFRSLGDGLGDSLGYSMDSLASDTINEKQVVYAEAQAAGLFKGGIRRAAFSMGDLQALQPPEPPSPRSQAPRPPVSSSGASKAPRLESVPESKALPATTPLLGDDMLMSSRLSGLSSGSGAMGDGLEGLGLDQLSADLLSASSHHFASDVPMPMFDETSAAGHEAEEGLPAPVVKSEPIGMPPITGPLGLQGFPSSSGGGPSRGLFDYPFMNGHGDKKPPLPPESAMALRGYADELLGQSSKAQQQGSTSQAASGSPIKREPKDERRDEEQRQQQERMLRRSQSAVDLRSMATGGLPRHGSTGDLQSQRQYMVELTTPEGHVYTAGRLSNEERAHKILRYRQKRHERNFNKRIKYMCRKTLADSRPRVRGRFARNDDAAAVQPHETKKALAEKARKERKATNDAAAAAVRQQAHEDTAASLLDEPDFTADFSSLLPEHPLSSFGQHGMAPAHEAFDFPPVPPELYGRPPRSQPSSTARLKSGR